MFFKRFEFNLVIIHKEGPDAPGSWIWTKAKGPKNPIACKRVGSNLPHAIHPHTSYGQTIKYSYDLAFELCMDMSRLSSLCTTLQHILYTGAHTCTQTLTDLCKVKVVVNKNLNPNATNWKTNGLPLDNQTVGKHERPGVALVCTATPPCWRKP